MSRVITFRRPDENDAGTSTRVCLMYAGIASHIDWGDLPLRNLSEPATVDDIVLVLQQNDTQKTEVLKAVLPDAATMEMIVKRAYSAAVETGNPHWVEFVVLAIRAAMGVSER